MKIGGVEIKGPNEVLLVLPRSEGDLIIKARAVISMDDFEELCPEPKAPGKQTKEGFEQNVNDPGYKQQMENHAQRRLGYLVMKSLEPSEIEWDQANIDNPSSWKNWQEDFKNAGLSNAECNHILQAVLEANALDESKLEAARQVFLHGQRQAQNESSGPQEEPATS